jgi:FkbM family methyltransferase
MMSENFFNRFANSHGPKYVFGVNRYADQIASAVRIDGFIDDFKNGYEHNGLPVVSLEAVSKKSMVVSSVTNSRPLTALKRLSEAGIGDVIDYFAFADQSDGGVSQIEAISDARLDYSANKERYDWVAGLMGDEKSECVFNDLLGFRLTADIKFLSEYSFRVDEQYFEPFIDFGSGDVFVDCGGFDGFTTKEFIKRCPDYGCVIFFEPDEKNMKISRAALAGNRRIEFVQKGVYSHSASLRFGSGQGSASQLTDSGDDFIEVVAFDEMAPARADFIKMDLEGAEPFALAGMRRTVGRFAPKLAISVYHDPSHFWRIPEMVLEMHADYKVLLRHYTEGWAETIMFFVPRS